MTPVIGVQDLCKEFRTIKRQPSFLGSIRTLFTRQYDVVRAVDHVSLSEHRVVGPGYLGEIAGR
jgi:ABC-2 type transport system ATP-binding protein